MRDHTTPAAAVFLSYASQDAAAAKRICEALRAAGVEVWFDQSELVGGDAWDQKIRKQIKECALLIPIISAATQARTEGYFRLEWRLADQRTHLMAKGRPFLLPVVIDATRDADAHVPDSFTEVQWTRLRLSGYAGQAGSEGEDVELAKFAARVSKLLGSAAVEASLDDVRSESGHGRRQATPLREKSAGPKWTKPILASAAIVIAVLAFTLVKKPRQPDSASNPAPVIPAAEVTSNPTVLRVKAILANDDITRAELDLASDLLAKTAEANSADSGVFAAWAFVDQRYLDEFYDLSPERLEAARRHAAKAIGLDPHSVDARLAQAVSLGRLTQDTATRTEVLKVLEALHREEPRNVQVMHQLAWCHYGLGQRVEAKAYLSKIEARPGLAGTTSYESGLMEFYSHNFGAALHEFERAKSVKGLLWRSYLQILWTGDIGAAQRSLQEVPAGYYVEDMPALAKFWVEFIARDYERALATMRTVPRDFIEAGAGFGPTGYYRGQALSRLGRKAAAESEWRSALKVVEQRLQKDSSRQLLVCKALLLSMLEDRVAADRVWQTARELGETGDWLEIDLAAHQLEPAAALTWIEKGLDTRAANATAAILRLNPAYDELRTQPGYAALQKRADEDPALSPRASQAAVPAVAAVPPDKSVAVLAFTNLSDDKANEYFSDGISEELLTVLQKIPGLKVSARTSAFSFKGKNATAQEIGRTLGVANLVEGSVRKAGSQVRITARLSRADTGEQLWSESYTRDLKDVFAVQTELAQAIVVALRAKLLGETGTELRSQVASQVSIAQKGGTTNVEAHELYLQGRYFANQPSLANIDKAVDYFQRAVDTDSSFALAWAALGRSVALQAEYFATTPQDLRERFARARRAVDRALALAPDLADGYFARIEIQASYDYDWVGARESTERIFVLAPSNALFISNASQLTAQFGDLEKGIRLGRQAAELDPVNAEVRYWLARVYQMAGRLPEAEAEFRRAAELSPSVLSIHRQQSLLLVQQGRAEAAVTEARLEGYDWSREAALAVACWAAKDTRGADAALARLIAVAADSAGYQVAEAYAFRGEADRAFEWLERAYLNRDSGLGWVRVDPLLKNLRSDPRWTAFVRKVGLADDQLK